MPLAQRIRQIHGETSTHLVATSEAAAHDERVVLVPCSGGTARQWHTLVDALHGFRPIPLDLWGHGPGRAWMGLGPLDLRQEASAIAQACPGGGAFHLVGHSYGGAVALAFAGAHPGRVRSLTLIEPACFPLLTEGTDDEPHLREEIARIAEAVTRDAAGGDGQRAMARFVDYWSGAGAWAAMPADRRTRLARLAVIVAHHFRSALADAPTRAELARLQIPTLVICGTASPAPSRAVSRLVAEAMPDARHRTIAQAGHMSPITHAAEVNALVRAHLERSRSLAASAVCGGVY